MRITPSRFGEVSSMTKRRNIEKLCHSLYSPPFLHTAAIIHGKTFENKAIQLFEARFSMKVREAGLHVRPDLSYLGASPDGLLDDNAIVEVKCPYNGRNALIKPSKMFSFLCYENSEVKLKRQRNYYDQVQGQMHICKKSLCYFIVYTHKDLFVEKIPYEVEYCKSALVPKLEIFFKKYYLNYIVRHAF